jgi:aminopeptidase N
MSSYLLAFVVSDFGFISNADGLPAGETLHRIYARKDDVARAQYALDNSVKFLKELEEYNAFTYELSKMFSVALPDFAIGISSILYTKVGFNCIFYQVLWKTGD